MCTFFFRGLNVPRGPRPPVLRSVIILRHDTVGRAAMDKLSVRRRDLHLTTHNNHERQTSTPHRGSKSKSQQASDRSADPRHRPRGHWDWRAWSSACGITGRTWAKGVSVQGVQEKMLY